MKNLPEFASSCTNAFTFIADSTGKVRIWDTTNKEHILKSEFTPISGAIRDLAWSPDSQKIVAVGEGREK